MSNKSSSFNLLGVGLFVFGYIFGFAVMAAIAMCVPPEASFMREMGLSTFIELAACAFVVWLFFFLRKRHDGMCTFTAAPLSRRAMWGLFLVMPMWVFVQILIGNWNDPSFFVVDHDVAWRDLGKMAVELPLVAVIGPVFEEFCFRILPVTAFRSRTGRIVAAVATTLLFALMHVTRWHIVVVGSMIYTAALLFTRNIRVPILLHIFHNLSTILLPAMGTIFVLLFPRTTTGILGLPVAIVALVAIMFVAGCGLLLSILRHRKS